MEARIKWTPEMDALLGTAIDQDVADELGLDRSTVSKRRRDVLGIPALGVIQWTPKMDALLGTMPDPAVDARLGLRKNGAYYRRNQLGIAPWAVTNRVLPKEVSAYDPEAFRIYTARRTHQKLGLPDTLTYEQWKYACEWFDHRCAYCGEKAFLTEDHLRPLSDGGPRTALNIIPCCSSCNSSKGTKQAHLWIYEQFGMTKGKELVEKIVAYLTEVKGKCLPISCRS